MALSIVPVQLRSVPLRAPTRHESYRGVGAPRVTVAIFAGQEGFTPLVGSAITSPISDDSSEMDSSSSSPITWPRIHNAAVNSLPDHLQNLDPDELGPEQRRQWYWHYKEAMWAAATAREQQNQRRRVYISGSESSDDSSSDDSSASGDAPPNINLGGVPLNNRGRSRQRIPRCTCPRPQDHYIQQHRARPEDTTCRYVPYNIDLINPVIINGCRVGFANVTEAEAFQAWYERGHTRLQYNERRQTAREHASASRPDSGSPGRAQSLPSEVKRENWRFNRFLRLRGVRGT